jgi:copper(I)-binding protein
VTSVRARRTTTLLAAGLLPLLVAGCGVGLHPQTYKERTTQDAANAQAGALALRDVAIAPPDADGSEITAGKDAQLTLAVVNGTDDSDTLTGVSTAAAASTKLVDSSGHAVTDVEVPARGSADAFGVVLIGITKALRPGMYVDVTFTFAKNGRSKVSVPMKLYAKPVPRASYQPKPAEQE